MERLTNQELAWSVFMILELLRLSGVENGNRIEDIEMLLKETELEVREFLHKHLEQLRGRPPTSLESAARLSHTLATWVPLAPKVAKGEN